MHADIPATGYTAMCAQRLARLRTEQTVLVIGSGISGLLHIQLARARGAARSSRPILVTFV